MADDSWFVIPEYEVFALDIVLTQKNYAFLTEELLVKFNFMWHFIHF